MNKMPWYFVFIFFILFSTSDTVTIIFWMCYSESHLITATFKFVLNNCEARWQKHFERNLKVKDFTDIGQHKCYFFRLNIMNRKLPTVHEKLSVTKKPEPALRKKLHQNTRWYFTYFNTLPFLSPTNLVFKTNPVITE